MIDNRGGTEMRIRILLATVAVASAGILGTGAPSIATTAAPAATATTTSTDPDPSDVIGNPEVLTDTDSVGMTPMGTDGPGLIKMTDPDGPITLAKGAGGRSSASGCARFYVQKISKNILGSQAYKARVWTDACWNRAAHTVTVNATGRTILNVGDQWYYRGVISSARNKYTWNGYAGGGYHHFELLGFENCVLRYGCIGSRNARMTINVHYNGTYNWYTDGDTNG